MDNSNKDEMGKLHNKIVLAINESKLSVAEVCLVIDTIKQAMLDTFRKEVNGS